MEQHLPLILFLLHHSFLLLLLLLPQCFPSLSPGATSTLSNSSPLCRGVILMTTELSAVSATASVSSSTTVRGIGDRRCIGEGGGIGEAGGAWEGQKGGDRRREVMDEFERNRTDLINSHPSFLPSVFPPSSSSPSSDSVTSFLCRQMFTDVL